MRTRKITCAVCAALAGLLRLFPLDLLTSIREYLDIYMSDAPAGHRWIVLASLYLTYVARRPMHPIERADVIVESRDGSVRYCCPNKIPGDNPICDACVCEPVS